MAKFNIEVELDWMDEEAYSIDDELRQRIVDGVENALLEKATTEAIQKVDKAIADKILEAEETIQDIASCDNAKYMMGSYSNNEEAVKHMEMCRKHYAAAEYNRRIITKADTVADMEIAGKLLTSGFIFQFPK